MEKTEKFFIFTWKELVVIALLFLTLVGFFFTLGLHYGKKINQSAAEHKQTTEEADKLVESPETLPPREVLEEGSQHANAVSADTIKEATKQEVAKSAVKIDSPKAVTLPSEKTEPAPEIKHEAKPVAVYSIQLGSYTSKKEALQKVKALAKKKVDAEIRTAEVNRQTRYRVVIPGFRSKASADQRGRELKQKHKIESFIVIR